MTNHKHSKHIIYHLIKQNELDFMHIYQHNLSIDLSYQHRLSILSPEHQCNVKSPLHVPSIVNYPTHFWQDPVIDEASE